MKLVKAKTTRRFGGEPYITLPRGAKVGSTASESNVFKSITYGFKQVSKDPNSSTDPVSVEEFKKDAQVKFYSKDVEDAEFPYEFNVYGYNSVNEGANFFVSVIELPDHNGLNLLGKAILNSNDSGNLIIGVYSATSEEGLPPTQDTTNILYFLQGTLSDGVITDTDDYCSAAIQNPFTPGIDDDSRLLYELFSEVITMGISSGIIFPEEPDPEPGPEVVS